MDLLSAIMIGIFIFMSLYLFWMWFCFGTCVERRQKTRSSQQRRTFIGARQRPSDTEGEPTIYVSPANLPPPPKYEAMAPPSYEEVVGIHYPNFQPISQPISTALAQNSNSSDANAGDVNVIATNNGEINSNTQTSSTVLSVISERAPVTASS